MIAKGPKSPQGDLRLRLRTLLHRPVRLARNVVHEWSCVLVGVVDSTDAQNSLIAGELEGANTLQERKFFLTNWIIYLRPV